jgi:rSAM/selenodomain-associated transferase 2
MASALAPLAARSAMSAARTALRVAVIVPALNEEAAIGEALRSAREGADSLIVVDGGSTNDTVGRAQAAAARVIRSEGRGRALQMNAGARSIDADVLLFLHADAVLPGGWRRAVCEAIGAGAGWGRFDVRLDDRSALLATVGAMMNLRSRVTGICTGDQGIFVAQAAWQAVGGFAEIPLMEDIELSGRLRRKFGRPACLRLRVRASSRRWRAGGPWRTIIAMWCWRALYFLGASPGWLHRRYYRNER